MKKRPIGVFDSGIGGLTVLTELIKLFPHEDFYYVADQGYCPYGPRPKEYVEDRVRKITQNMLDNDCKAIVIACNTASLRIYAAREIANIPVISVIEPTAKRAISLTKNKKIAVLATQATINSGTYQNILKESGVEAYGLACGEFVDFVEHNELTNPLGDKIVSDKLQQIKDLGFDTLIHGCTHFSLLEPQMRKVLGDINYVACGLPTGEELKTILKKEDLCRCGKGTVKIFTTGKVEDALMTMKWFTLEHQPIEHIEIK